MSHPSKNIIAMFTGLFFYDQVSGVADIAAIRQTVSEMLFHVESKVSSRTTAQYPSNYKFSQQLS